MNFKNTPRFFWGCFIFVCGSCYATNYDWTLTSGTGDWNDSSNWNDGSGSYPQSSSDTATFGSSITGEVIVNVPSSFAVDSITLSSDQTITLNDSGSGGITLGGGSSTYKLAVTGGGIYNVGIPLSLTGTGTANVSNGALNTTVNSALPSTMSCIFTYPATLDVGATTQTIGSLTNTGQGLGGGSINVGTGSGAGAFTFGDSTNQFFGGPITDSNGSSLLTKQGSGTTIWTGGASIAIDVIGGELFLDTEQISGNISVGSGATVGGDANISGFITLSSGAILQPGPSADTVGTMNLINGRNITFDNNSTYLITLFPGAASNTIITDTTTLLGNLEFTVPTDFDTGAVTNTYPILEMSSSTYSGTFNAPTFPSGYIITVDYPSDVLVNVNVSTDWEWNLDGSGDWTTSSNWAPNNGDYPNASYVMASFGDILTSSSVVSLPTALSVDQLSFDTTNGFSYTLSGSNPLTIGALTSLISFAGNASHTIAIPLVLADDIGIVQSSTATPTISGNISGTGNLTLSSGSLNLSGTNTYTGQTIISSGAVLYAQSTGALSSSSIYNVTGTLNLQGNSNSVNRLGGSGSVITTGSEILTITSGGIFSGTISGTGGVTLSGGTLRLSGANSYSGNTTVSSGTTIQAMANNTLSSLSSYTVNGTLTLSTFQQQINSLNGSGKVTNNSTLTVSNGGTFTGAISGTGSLTVSGGTLVLSGTNNTYTGTTTIGSLGTLQSGANNSLPTSSSYTVDGTLNLSSYQQQIKSLNGSGTVSAGSLVTITNGGTFSGGVSGSGSLTISGGSLTLSGSNTYLGATTINSGTFLVAGSTSALSNDSSFTVNGTLNLSGYSNEINSLQGSGSVITTGSEILTVGNGGTFTGTISGTGALTVSGGTLVLSNTGNTYTGDTTVSVSGTLQSALNNSLSTTSDYTVNGTLDLGSNEQQIGSLNGSGTVSVDSLITITDGGSFSGTIEGTGAVNLSSGSLILSGSNTYTGQTTISSGSFLSTESSAALSTDSDIVLDGTLTIADGGTLAGAISGTGALDLTGGTLTLSGVNTLVGTVDITGGTLVSSVDDTLPTNSDFLVESGGTLAIDATSQDILSLSGGGLVTIGSGGNLTVGSSSSGVFSGMVTGSDSSSILTKNTTNSFFFTGTSSIPGGLVVDAGKFFVNTENWTAPIEVMSGATLGGIGTISGKCYLEDGAIIAPGNGTIAGTLTFSPNSTVVFLGSSSTYSVEVASTGVSQLILTADTVLNGIVSVTTPLNFVPSSKPYTIIKMKDGSSYQGKFDTLSISQAYNAQLIYEPNAVLFTFYVNPISNLDLSKLSGNQKILADYIDEYPEKLVYINTLGLSELESALNTISTARNYASAYALQNSAFAFSSQLSSHISDKRFFHYLGKKHEEKEAVNLMQALSKKMGHVREVADLMNEFAEEEISEPLSEPVSEAVEEEKTISAPTSSSFQLWATGFGQFGHQDKTGQGQNPAFNFTAEGTLVGFDYDLKNGQVGGAVGYAHDHIAMEHQFGSNQANSVITSVYGSYFEGDFFCDLSFLTGVSFFKNDRHVFFPGFDEHAKSSYTAWMIDPHFGCGYHFDFDWSALEPYFSVDAAIVFEEKYSETGAAPFNFTQKSRSSEMLRTEVGLSAYQETKAGENGMVLFKESVSYVSRVLWGSMQSAFVGAASGVALVTTPGTQNLFSPKFEALYKWEEFTFSVVYEGEFGSGYIGNEIFGKFNYEF